jgi:hypothetical protein
MLHSNSADKNIGSGFGWGARFLLGFTNSAGNLIIFRRVGFSKSIAFGDRIGLTACKNFFSELAGVRLWIWEIWHVFCGGLNLSLLIITSKARSRSYQAIAEGDPDYQKFFDTI